MTTEAFRDAAQAIVSPEHIRAASVADVIAGKQPKLVIQPGNEQELAQVLKLADDAALAVLPRGGGSKLDWGNPPDRADLLLSTARLNRILEHAWSDLTVTVEAGCTIRNLQETLAQHGQRLALDPLWPDHATIGGVLSTNDSGALRLRLGALRDLIIGVTLALPDGTLASSGGKVVKNVAGYDLPKLVTGALGTLAVITRAVFRLHPRPKETRTISCVARDLREAQRLLLAVQDSQLAHSALQVRFNEHAKPEVDILFEGTQAGLEAQAEKVKTILAGGQLIESGSGVWNARQDLYGSCIRSEPNCALAKTSVLPAQIAETLESLAGFSARGIHSAAVVQATGLGCIRFEGQPEALHAALREVRARIERPGGSLVIAQRPVSMPPLDAWGQSGDALLLMRAVKEQFDPKATLNPGRFVGGI
jgi:glycolate dehydrogenase FAD-binding subunit